MGMYDNVYVSEKNKVGIPEPIDFYQSAGMDWLLTDYLIDEEGRLSVKKEGIYEGENEEAVKTGTFTGVFDLYGESAEGHKELYLYVENNIVKFVFEFNKILYKSEDVLIPVIYQKFQKEYTYRIFEFLLEVEK